MADYHPWVLGWILGGAVIVVVAALLLWILLATGGIERQARRVLTAARRVEANTRPIWRLAEAREAVETALDNAEIASGRMRQQPAEAAAVRVGEKRG